MRASLERLPRGEGGVEWVRGVIEDMRPRHLANFRRFLDDIAQGNGRRKIFVAMDGKGELAGFTQLDVCADAGGGVYGQMEAWVTEPQYSSRATRYVGRSLASSLMDAAKLYAVASGAHRLESNTTKGLSSEAAHLRQGYEPRPGLYPTPALWLENGGRPDVGAQMMLTWTIPSISAVH
ncbi:hypothetical protein ACIRRA_37785 [Nocardia sp. NPDC101769]|uniref:hypothetical protein n=1 Tax=Nocardia sp. NPDC101769 TaxID=3364333 RepID=UPI0038138806